MNTSRMHSKYKIAMMDLWEIRNYSAAVRTEI